MLLARYAPIGSPRFEKLSNSVRKYDKIVDWLSPQLFAIWTTFVIGMSVGKARIDRHYFWDWSDWLIGVVGILIITITLNLIKTKINKFPFRSNDLSFENRGYNAFMPLTLLAIGFVVASGFHSMLSMLLYLFPYSAIFIIHTVLIDSKSKAIPKESNKHIKSILSILLLAIATIIGSLNDDPLLATASMVSLPFVIVLLFGKHIRHLERAKFYPIFIFAMFVSSREGWFIIPLFLLFHLLRSFNYLANQKVYPTFGVSE